jgi:hypothetical protein
LPFSSPHDPDLTITKRIIALEGDTVRPLPQSNQKEGTVRPNRMKYAATFANNNDASLQLCMYQRVIVG